MNMTSLAIRNPFGVLITKAQREALQKAGYAGTDPIIKLFVGPLTWLITGEEDGILYGWADLSMNCVEWGGLVHVNELPSIKQGPFYLERDRYFKHVPGTKYGLLETLAGI